MIRISEYLQRIIPSQSESKSCLNFCTPVLQFRLRVIGVFLELVCVKNYHLSGRKGSCKWYPRDGATTQVQQGVHYIRVSSSALSQELHSATRCCCLGVMQISESSNHILETASLHTDQEVLGIR